VALPSGVDLDRIPDSVDNRLDVANFTQSDRDGVGDARDVCPNEFDPDQTDTNGDGMGDACQPIEGACYLPDVPDGGCENLSEAGCAALGGRV